MLCVCVLRHCNCGDECNLDCLFYRNRWNSSIEELDCRIWEFLSMGLPAILELCVNITISLQKQTILISVIAYGSTIKQSLRMTTTIFSNNEECKFIEQVVLRSHPPYDYLAICWYSSPLLWGYSKFPFHVQIFVGFFKTVHFVLRILHPLHFRGSANSTERFAYPLILWGANIDEQLFFLRRYSLSVSLRVIHCMACGWPHVKRTAEIVKYIGGNLDTRSKVHSREYQQMKGLLMTKTSENTMMHTTGTRYKRAQDFLNSRLTDWVERTCYSCRVGLFSIILLLLRINSRLSLFSIYPWLLRIKSAIFKETSGQSRPTKPT